MRRTPAALTTALALVLFGAFTPAGEKTSPFQQSVEETRVFELTNQERKKKDLSALTLNPALSKVARAHSANMARQGKMEHKLDDKDSNDRVLASGYKFASMAENLAAGGKDATLEMIVKAWMDSKSHRANILEAEFTEIGVGIARDTKGQLYYTQVFARPAR